MAHRDPIRRILVRTIAFPALKLLGGRIRRRICLKLSFPHNLLCLGERFGKDASLQALLHQIRRDKIRNVLVPGGSIGGEDVQFWLRRGIRQLAVVDVVPQQKTWESVSPQIREYFGVELTFQNSSIESTPFKNASFDLIASEAVLEHVRNLSALCQETARILRPGGWAWHGVGPLYFTHGGDHCIAAYGREHGYDHLLLDEQMYRKKIIDEDFYKRHADPNSRFWAIFDQLSFATTPEYLQAFSQHFDIVHLLVQISEDGLWFRSHCPEKWGLLLDNGLAEEDLLIKGLMVVLRKRSDS